MSDNNTIIMPSPRKSDNHEYASNTGVRYNSIQSGVTISGQMCQYQVIVYVKYQVIACQLSSVRSQVSSNNMLSTGVRYQVSEIRCQVITVKYRCQISSVRYQVSSNNMSSTGVRY